MIDTSVGAVGGTARVQAALAELAAGGMVIVRDAAERENEADLVVAAESATTEQLAFMVRHSTGIICVPMPAQRMDRLQIPLMVADNTDAHGTAFGISVDHCTTSTGVSADDRMRTARALAAGDTTPGALRRPGHVFPLRAHPAGVLARAGHTEASVDLLRLAGLTDVAVIGELTTDRGAMMRDAELLAFASGHELPVVDIADLVRYRLAGDSVITESSSARLPTAFGTFTATAFRTDAGEEHLAVSMGDVASLAVNESGCSSACTASA